MGKEIAYKARARMHIYIRAYKSFFDRGCSPKACEALIHKGFHEEQTGEQERPRSRKGSITMTYYRWMMKKYRYDVTMAGRLAREMHLDPGFPRKAERTEVLDYLLRNGATSNCIWAFEVTWQEFERSAEAGGGKGRPKEARGHKERVKEPYRRVWCSHRRKRRGRNERITQ